MGTIRLKRVYESAEPNDGGRYLVDRLWPRGVSKERAALDGWLKNAAPSAELRRMYCHDPAKREEFRRLYREELAAGGEELRLLRRLAAEGPITLVYAAKDAELSHALILRDFLEEDDPCQT